MGWFEGVSQLAVAALLAGTIPVALRLERALRAVRRDRETLEGCAAVLDEAPRRAGAAALRGRGGRGGGGGGAGGRGSGVAGAAARRRGELQVAGGRQRRRRTSARRPPLPVATRRSPGRPACPAGQRPQRPPAA